MGSEQTFDVAALKAFY